MSSEVAKITPEPLVIAEQRQKFMFIFLSPAELTSVPDSMKVVGVMFLNTTVSFSGLRTKYI